MTKTVWVIEQGEYSDYHVVGVFSTRENAELVLSKMKDEYDKPEITEWPLDPAVDALNQGMTRWIVWMRKDGTTERCDSQEFSSYDVADEINEWERERAPAFKGNGDKPNVLMAKIWATDSQHAVKIVNERRIQILAADQWKGKL